MLLANKRIFMVEDNLDNKAIAQTLLEREGAKVVSDRWGLDAIERLQKFAPADLILLDLMLPRGISGFDIYQQIRQLAQFDSVPVAIISAADASSAVPKAQAMGFTGFISKPINFRLFTQQIRWIIEGRTVWSTNERL